MFLTWLDLLPQMQAFEHRLFGKRAWDKSKERFCPSLFFDQHDFIQLSSK